jgi:Multisubunit Na+/H+ antiporter, MnhE subunit
MKIIKKIIVVTEFFFYYLKELIKANLILSYDILTPTNLMKPGIVEIPLDLKTDNEIITLVNLVTMTPGSLSLDISEDKTRLYVHVLYLDDASKFREEVKSGLEKRVKEVWS